MMMTLAEICTIAAITVAIWAIFMDGLKRFVLTVPGYLIQYAMKHLTVKMTIKSSDELFNLMAEWLSQQPYTKKARNLRMVYSSTVKDFVYVPGAGRHVIWYQGVPIVIEHTCAGAKPGTNPWATPVDDETYNITIFGRKRGRLQTLVKEVLAVRRGSEITRKTTSICTWRGSYWNYLSPRRKRDMSTVYMDEPLRDDLIKDITWFIGSEAWYLTRGIPYRRGYLLYGPPGTGKTTLATALAGYFDRPICIVNLTTIGGDDNLMNSFANAPRDAIILIEDVDTFTVSNQRQTQAPDTSSEESSSDGKKQQGVTLAGLLNAIDGVAASEGRLLIMTTNHYEKLDMALVRAGRVDKKSFIGPLTASAVEHMFCNFYPDHQDQKHLVYEYAIVNVEQPCAQWQELYMKYQEDPKALFAFLKENTLKAA